MLPADYLTPAQLTKIIIFKLMCHSGCFGKMDDMVDVPRDHGIGYWLNVPKVQASYRAGGAYLRLLLKDCEDIYKAAMGKIDLLRDMEHTARRHNLMKYLTGEIKYLNESLRKFLPQVFLKYETIIDDAIDIGVRLK